MKRHRIYTLETSIKNILTTEKRKKANTFPKLNPIKPVARGEAPFKNNVTATAASSSS